MFPNCGKSRQSPVNIELCETEHEESCIQNNYKGADAKVGMVLKNNGHSAQIDLSHVEGLHTTVFGKDNIYIVSIENLSIIVLSSKFSHEFTGQTFSIAYTQ